MPQDPTFVPALRAFADELRTTTQFSEAFALFERGFMRNDRFFRSCDWAQDPLLDGTLAQLAHRFFGPSAPWGWTAPMLRYAPARFLHGIAVLDGHPTVVTYFEEDELGLACIVTGRDCVYTRFTKLPVPQAAVVSRDRGHT